MCQILVIDDDSFHRSTLQLGLEKLGYEVRTAHDGRHALEVMGEPSCLPSAVITDMVMPEMDGLEVIQYFRKHYPAIPVVAISGEVPEYYLHLAIRLGARAVMVKPIHFGNCQKMLAEILGVEVPDQN